MEKFILDPDTAVSPTKIMVFYTMEFYIVKNSVQDACLSPSTISKESTWENIQPSKESFRTLIFQPERKKTEEK